ncbi:hypothetical protein HK104_011148 [Borealophlyctis nickersoniae]|nr:hypothetical protein HK104_011148 [Borealophlyctis nickersoniae]
MPRPQTVHESTFALPRPSTLPPTPGAGYPPSRHSMHAPHLRSRATTGGVGTRSHAATPLATSDLYHFPEDDYWGNWQGYQQDGEDPSGADRSDADGVENDRDEVEAEEEGEVEGGLEDLGEGEERTVKNVQEAINISHPFGLRIWKPALYRKFRSIDAQTDAVLHSTPGALPERKLYLYPGNILWMIVFGWWIAAVYWVTAVFLLGPVALIGWIGKVLINLSNYMLWPFGKFIARRRARYTLFAQDSESPERGEPTERTGLLSEENSDHINDEVTIGIDGEGTTEEAPTPRARNTQRSDETGSILSDDVWSEYSFSTRRPSRASLHDPTSCLPSWTPLWVHRTIEAGFAGNLFWVVSMVTIAPLQFLISAICFFFIFPLPMAKLNYVMLKHLLRHPLQLSAHTPPPFLKENVRPRAASAPPAPMPTSPPAGDVFPDINGPASAAADPSKFPWRPISVPTALPNLPPADPVLIPTTLGEPAHIPATLVLPHAIPRLPSTAHSRPSPEFHVILCTYTAMGSQYYKYTVDGINIFIVNLLAVVFFCLADFYVIGPRTNYTGLGSHVVLFLSSLLATVPLAYFIGMAVASITSETGSLALGAVINATFGSIIEIILYMLALMEGKDRVVEGAIIGSLLCGLLALPGASMFAGGLKRKEQKFNAKSAGVTSTMLIMALIGAFTPTLFQEVFGEVEIRCGECPLPSTATGVECKRCRVVAPHPTDDPVYKSSTRPLMYFCAGSLVLVYAVGLWFTLRTHSKRIYGPRETKERSVERSVGGDASVSTGGKRKKGGVSTPLPLQIATMQGRRVNAPRSASVTGTPGTPLGGGWPSATDANGAVDGDLAGKEGGGGAVPPLGLASPMITPRTEFFDDASSIASTMSTHAMHQGSAQRQSRPFSSHLPPTPGGTMYPSTQTDGDGKAGAHGAAGGHDHPNWSTTKSALVLLGATVLYSLIAEVLIDSVDVVLENFVIGQKFVGVTLFALVPTVTEFYNAIAFSMQDNIALSLEIGSAYAMQVALLQIPAMVAFSAYMGFGTSPPPSIPTPKPSALSLSSSTVRYPFSRLSALLSTPATPAPTAPYRGGFTLVFPRWDVTTVLFGVFILTYIYNEGKSNYFKGSMLLLAYSVIVLGYWFEPEGDESPSTQMLSTEPPQPTVPTQPVSGGEGQVPGSPLHTETKATTLAAAATQDFAPLKSICRHVDAFHFYAHDMARQVQAEHYCSHLSEDFLQCVLYDTPEKDARLIGVEYIISERLFKSMPSSEKVYWHSHVYEIKGGVLTLPVSQLIPASVHAEMENAVCEKLVRTYGKTFHFWQVDRGDELPFGPPSLMMSFTADGQLDPELVAKRDKMFNVDTQELKERRQHLPSPEIDPEADHWKKGEVWQCKMEKVPFKGL